MKTPTFMLLAAALGATAAQAGPPAEILIPGRNLTTESLTSSADGSVYIGSMGTGAIFRAKPGAATAAKWIEPHTDGMDAVLGVLADDASKTLWVCSSSADDEPSKTTPPSALYAFDLGTGAPKGKWPLPTAGAFCNDIAIGPDGTAYVSDTHNMEILRLKPKAKALDVWAGHGDFGPKGGVLDGIAFLAGHVVVNALETNKLFSVPVGADGKAGKVQEVKLDHPIHSPDGQRTFGSDGILIIEAGDGGRLSRIRLSGPGLTIGKVTEVKRGFPNDPTAVTVVGELAYVAQAQWDESTREKQSGYKPVPYTVVGIPVGKP